MCWTTFRRQWLRSRVGCRSAFAPPNWVSRCREQDTCMAGTAVGVWMDECEAKIVKCFWVATGQKSAYKCSQFTISTCIQLIEIHMNRSELNALFAESTEHIGKKEYCKKSVWIFVFDVPLMCLCLTPTTDVMSAYSATTLGVWTLRWRSLQSRQATAGSARSVTPPPPK